MNDNSKLPQIVSQLVSGTQSDLTVMVPEDCVWFTGHFDEAPILSGVAQLDWVMHLAWICWPAIGDFRGVEVLKFQNVIQPGDRIAIRLEWDEHKHKLHFAMSDPNQKPFSSGRILLKNSGGDA